MPEPQRSPSLRGRLLLGLLMPLLSLLAFSGLITYLVSLHYANSVYDGWLYDSVSSLALALEPSEAGMTLNLHGSAQRLFEWDVTDKTYFKVSSNRNGVIAGRPDIPRTPVGAKTYRNAQLFYALLDGAAVRVASLTLPGVADEQILIQVAETQRKRDDLARQILINAMLPQLLLIGVAAALIWFGVRTGLAPLRAVAANIGDQTHRTLQPIADDGMPIEIRPLTQALNDLLARLEAALASQRKFVADAAHQLRTPLAALKLHLEQAQQESSPEALRALLSRLRVSTDRAARLSHQLLSLARAEPEAADQQPMERVDLRVLARETGAEWVPRALQKNINLGFEARNAQVSVQGNPLLLREALNNLLDNAVKYHPGNGRITLVVSAAPQPSLVVEDDGPGIPAGQRALVLQRFNRGDRSGGEGSGLGLSIVKEIATLHGGSLHLEDGPGGRGLSVRLRLPALER